jgi:hypothetical protein
MNKNPFTYAAQERQRGRTLLAEESVSSWMTSRRRERMLDVLVVAVVVVAFAILIGFTIGCERLGKTKP